jgi:hypothetical protein
MSHESNPKQLSTPNPQELRDDIVLTRRGIDAVLKQGEQAGDLESVQAAVDGLKLKTANNHKLLEKMQAPLRAVRGKNFLGAEEWGQGFGVHVGAPPVIPGYITAELLNSA